MNEVSTEKTMTVQELADNLHVSDKTIRRTIISINETLDSTDQGYIHTENGIAIRLTEAQCTRIKMELEGHHNLADNTAVKTVSNDMEYFAKSIELQKYATARIAELEKQNKEQKQQLIEQQPKVEFFDAVASSHDAIDMGNVAKVLECKLGRNQIFDILRRKGVLQSNNVPYQKFIDAGFFRVIEQKYGTPDGSVHVNIKTLVYQRGIDYIRKIIQMNQKEGK